MRLTTAAIDRYGPLYDCRPPFEDGLTVLSGPNEAGKTLYLEALLQLLEPEAADVMTPPPRVGGAPTGRVVVESGGEQYECDGDTSVCDVSAIEPRHLQSVFVVRDSDLALPSDQAYYTSLIETLGEVHTTEIDAIQAALKDRGRLTDARLNISSDQSFDNAGDVHDDAEALAAEIRDYTGKIEAEGLGELDARRLRLKRALREASQRREAQEEAKTVAEYEHLSEQLETYLSASDQLAALERFDRQTLDELRELRNDLERDRGDLESLESDIESKVEEVEATGETLEDLETRGTELERREAAVRDARSALETYRDRQNEATGAERRLTLAKYATVAGLLAAGGAGVAGAITGSLPALGLGVVLLLASIASGAGYRRSNQRLSAVETARGSVLQRARDAGFDVEGVEEIAPAVESFDGERSRVRDRVARKGQQHQDAEERLSDLRGERSDLESEIAEQERSLTALLEAAEVESISEYRERVDARESLEPDRQTARQSLIDRFGEPEADDPDAVATVWKRALDDLVSDVAVDDVDADDYDENSLRELEVEVDRLRGELDELQARLEEHDDELDGFDRRARELTTRPFIDRSLGLDSRSKDGLETLASDLDAVVDEIEADAELSRKALAVFDRIEAREEQKLADLFEPDGPASRTFEQVTGGRYTEVAYDAADHEIVVERRDGRTLPPEMLSQGTKDQLYFATRVSLARQLLGNESGFLLLDDPFLAADPERLRRGFETLHRLADDGWQILYLTAKQEVSESMVAEYDLEHARLEALSSATPSAASSR
jgi:DNA repair exonuclease SbcCD ATPase subunit